jgi:hypothetical protein
VPTTLTGLLLFVVLLLPGFAYLVGKERHGTARSLSPFRETVAIVAASISSEIIVLGLFSAVRALWPGVTPSPGALIVNGGAYVGGTHGHPGHYKIVALWGLVLLAAATLGAYLATKPKVRGLLEKLRLTGPYPHDSTVSAWWVLFERWPSGRDVQVACVLDDGSVVKGRFGSFNNSADDSPDRDLILRKPIYYRPAGEKSIEVPYAASAACFPARRIVTVFVAYSEPVGANSSRSQEGPGSQTQAASASVPSAASPTKLAASGTAGTPTQVLRQASPLPKSSGLSALRQRLRGLRPW